MDIFGEQDIDVLCSGNHELYHNQSAEDEHSVMVPKYKGRYLASNIDIIDGETGKRTPLAQRYKKFTTKNQGIRIMTFGFLFDFNNNSPNTIVQKVEDTIKEAWFQTAIRDREVDLFLVIGHVAPRSPEFANIFRAIRTQNWDTPIQFFGGHTHIRDYVKYDAKAYAMESGRYMETIGFMSINGVATGGKSRSLLNGIPFFKSSRATATSPTFSRRYIDNNLYSFYHHTNLNSSTFPTSHGRNVSRQIAEDRKALKLDHKYGCAPHTYWTNRAPFPSKDSIFTWLQDVVLPDMVKDKERSSVPRTVLINSGALRFDIFKGPFTIDSMYIVSPFTSGFRYIKDVPFKDAKRLKAILNQEVPQLWDASQSMKFKSPRPVVSLCEDIDKYYSREAHDVQKLLADDKPGEDLVPGYTTKDDAGSDGDDTIHASIQFYNTPNCLESHIDFPMTSEREDADPETVDLVYVDFIEKYILLALKFLGTDYTSADTDVYMKGETLTDVIGKWAQRNWDCSSDNRTLDNDQGMGIV